VLLETETDTERRENVLAARFRDTERESAGVGLTMERICVPPKAFLSVQSAMTRPCNLVHPIRI
jgi:hypothetical protein